jgi:hypothetical protein
MTIVFVELTSFAIFVKRPISPVEYFSRVRVRIVGLEDLGLGLGLVEFISSPFSLFCFDFV